MKYFSWNKDKKLRMEESRVVWMWGFDNNLLKYSNSFQEYPFSINLNLLYLLYKGE